MTENEKGQGVGQGDVVDSGESWVTLKEAAETADVSVSALRKWYRQDAIASRLEPGPHGEQRVVRLQEVMDRATRRRPRPTPAAVAPPDPGGGVLVPREAWQQTLEQLGHLHEAGQQLAEARERAGKAETTSEFLRERVGQLQDEVKRLHDADREELGLRAYAEGNRGRFWSPWRRWRASA
jgi:DNA-binding transcriptional MerR regulator